MLNAIVKKMVKEEYENAQEAVKYDFPEYALHHAFRAVELAIAFKLDSQLSEEQKSELAKKYSEKGMTFTHLINAAKAAKILDTTSESAARKICNRRNMLAHPANYVALADWTIRNKDLLITKLLEEGMAEKLRPKINPKLLRNLSRKSIDLSAPMQLLNDEIATYDIPSLSWTARPDTLKAQTEDLENYIHELIRPDTVEKLFEQILRAKDKTDLQKRLSGYELRLSYLKEVTNDIMSLSKNVLTSMGFLC